MSDPLRPTGDGSQEAWKAHWELQGMAWRTEPEIDEEQKRFLAEHLAIQPNIERGRYPFKDITPPLTRADIEWLLATHDNGRGPVDWGDEEQRGRTGLDLRGCDLHGLNLSRLPLACLLGGLTQDELEQIASVDSTIAQQSDMMGTLIEQYYLRKPAAVASKIHMAGADLSGTHLEGAILTAADIRNANLCNTHLESAYLWFSSLEHGDFAHASLAGAHLNFANFEGTDLIGTRLVQDSQKVSRKSKQPTLPPADLRGAVFDRLSTLYHIGLGSRQQGFAMLGDVRWNGVNITVVNWSAVSMLGDERQARTRKTNSGARKTSALRLTQFSSAVRANRQVATVLREQGLNEDADRFAYRAQLCQRVVLRRQHSFLRYLGSWILDMISGYGYKPLRSFLTYVVIVSAFAAAYLFNAQFAAPHLTWDESLVLSVSAFHGRGFFTSGVSLGDTLARLAAGEAIIGLLIEITFIATFTQRFFAR